MTGLPSVSHHREFAGHTHLFHYVELAQQIPAVLLMRQLAKLVPVAAIELAQRFQPLANRFWHALLLQSLADAQATVMADDQNVGNTEVDGVLDGGKAVGVAMGDEVRDVAVDEHLARRQTYDFICRHSAVGASDPTKGRGLLGDIPVEELRVARELIAGPIQIVSEQLFEKDHGSIFHDNPWYCEPMTTRLSFALLLSATSLLTAAQAQKVDVRILSTMLADDDGFGEWGFSALVTVDGYPILFDTGAHPDTVLRNAKLLKVDLSGAADVILSHNHLDHTAGLITLRQEFKKSGALARAHVGKGIFTPRVRRDGSSANAMIGFKNEYEATGGAFVVYDGPREIRPGVWLTGPVPRVHAEKNWGAGSQLKAANGALSEDNLPEDQSLVIDTAKGLVVISGCGHAGVINTLEYARAKIRRAPIHAAIGGFHLYAATDDQLAWTAGKLKDFGLQQLLGAHCTGIEAVYRIRELNSMTRKTAAVGALGGGFNLEKGLEPGSISR